MLWGASLRRGSSLPLLAAGAGLAMLSIAEAEEPTDTTEPESPLTLPELVIGASLFEVPRAQVGSAVTVIPREQLEDQQVRIVSDVLRQVPGLVVNRYGPAGTQTEVRIRGAESRHTQVLIDGVRVNDPSAVNAVFDFAHLLNAEIDRIEVLRGPQSAIYGGDAIGGVVNIITRRGDGPPRITASVEGGSFGTFHGSAGVSGGDERGHGNLAVTYLHTDGISVGDRGSETDGYSNATLSFSGGIRPHPLVDLEATGRYVTARSDLDGAAPLDSPDYFRDREFSGRAQARITLLDGAWEQILGGNFTDIDRDYSDAAGHFIESSYSSQTWTVDYRTNYTFRTPELADAEHTLSFAVIREQQRALFDTPATGTTHASIASTGLVGEYRIGLWDEVFLSGAVRHDINENFPNATTFRVTAAYVQPDLHTRLHGSYGTGIKNPTLSDLFANYPAYYFYANPNLEQERSQGWDIGVEQPLWGDRVTVDVTYFHNEIENMFATDPVTFDRVVNIPGISTRRGVEVSLRARLAQGLDLTGSYTWTDARSATGQPLLALAEHTASGTLDYRFLEERANLNLSVVYVGEQLGRDYSTYPARAVTLESYALVNVAGSYRLTDQVEVYGRLENLLDRHFETYPGFQNPGFAGYGGLRVNFGVP